MSEGLAGRRVAITRPEPGAGKLAARLEAAGAIPVLLPLIAVAPPAELTPLRAAARQLQTYDWVVFTSANAVRALHDVLGTGPQAAPLPRVAVVGPATADAVSGLLGWPVAALPPRHSGDAMVAAMAAVAAVAGARVLWPRSEIARDALPRDLARAGAVVDAPVAYRTVPVPQAAQRLADLLAAGAVDVVVLTSPSAVEVLASARPRTGNAVFCAIGPATGDAARKFGIDVRIEPREHTISALIDSLQQHLRGLQHGQH